MWLTFVKVTNSFTGSPEIVVAASLSLGWLTSFRAGCWPTDSLLI